MTITSQISYSDTSIEFLSTDKARTLKIMLNSKSLLVKNGKIREIFKRKKCHGDIFSTFVEKILKEKSCTGEQVIGNIKLHTTNPNKQILNITHCKSLDLTPHEILYSIDKCSNL